MYLNHDAARLFLDDRQRELISQSTWMYQLKKVENSQELQFSYRSITEMMELLRSRLMINWDQKGLNIASQSGNKSQDCQASPEECQPCWVSEIYSADEHPDCQDRPFDFKTIYASGC